MTVNPDQIIIGTRATVQFFEISDPTLSRWVKAGCPKMARGLYDLKAVFKWFLENVLNGSGEGQSCEDKDLRESRALYWANKARLMEVQALKAQGELFNKAEIYQEWAARIGVFTSTCENLADRLPQILYGKTREEMWQIIGDEIWQMRDDLVKTGRYCPAIDPADIPMMPRSKPKPKKATGKKPKKASRTRPKSSRRKAGAAAKG